MDSVIRVGRCSKATIFISGATFAGFGNRTGMRLRGILRSTIIASGRCLAVIDIDIARRSIPPQSTKTRLALHQSGKPFHEQRVVIDDSNGYFCHSAPFL